MRATAKIRSRHEEAACTITLQNNNSALVEFDEPQRAITPGQAMVFYQSDVVIGGGWIYALAEPIEIGGYARSSSFGGNLIRAAFLLPEQMELNAHSKRFSYSIKTLGCKANIYDSMILENEIMGLGGVRNDDTPDLYILNSCTVTNGADKQSLLELQNFKKKSPKTLSLMTGCFVQVAEEKLSRNTSIDMLVPNDSKQGQKIDSRENGHRGRFFRSIRKRSLLGAIASFFWQDQGIP